MIDVSNEVLLWLATVGVGLTVLGLVGLLVCSEIDAESLGGISCGIVAVGLLTYLLSATIFYL